MGQLKVIDEVTLEQLFTLNPQFRRVLVALSGGLDSVVLLHRLANSSLSGRLRAIHVNHQLSSLADHWVRFCQTFCRTLAIPLQVVPVSVVSRGEGLEAAARTARYQAFREVLMPGELLATAHHAKDQAETVLLRMLRGSGVKGLGAMKTLNLSETPHWRPLLQVPKPVIKRYAQQHQLQFTEDASNLETKFDRNYVRHELLPRMEARWPAAVRSLTRVAEHCQQTEVILSDMGKQDMAHCQGSIRGTLSVQRLLALSRARRTNCLREWVSQQFQPPSQAILQEVESTLLSARQDKRPVVAWGKAEVRRYDGNLYLRRQPSKTQKGVDPLWRDPNHVYTLPDELGYLTAKPVASGILFPCQGLTVRFRQAGDVLRFPHRNVSKPLKKIFQEHRIPPWRRSQIPILVSPDNVIVAMVGVVAVTSPQPSGQITWEVEWHQGQQET